MNHPFTRSEDQKDHDDPEGGNYLRADDGLPDPLPDTGDNGDCSGFESEDNDRNTIDSMTEEEVNDEDEDSPSDDDIPRVGEQFYDDIAEWELDRLKALSGINQTLQLVNGECLQYHWSGRRLFATSIGNVIPISAIHHTTNFVDNLKNPESKSRVFTQHDVIFNQPSVYTFENIIAASITAWFLQTTIYTDDVANIAIHHDFWVMRLKGLLTMSSSLIFIHTRGLNQELCTHIFLSSRD